MTSDPPARRQRSGPRPVPSSDPGAVGFDDILTVLGQQLGVAAEQGQPRRTRLKNVTFEYDSDPRTVHQMAGDAGYSLASNWFTQRLAALAIANSVTKSEMCVFLYVAGGQEPGTGVATYTQQEIADGLNQEARRIGARCITRSTVNRAIQALCDYGWLEKNGHGAIRINVTLWFRGGSAAQHRVLEELDREKGGDRDAFPHYVGPPASSGQLLLPEDQDPEELSARQERIG